MHVSKRQRSASRGRRTSLSTLLALAIVLLIYVFVPELRPNDQPVPPDTSRRAPAGQRASANTNLALGNPSGATPDPCAGYLLHPTQRAARRTLASP